MSTTPLYGPPKVGGDILSYCTRCKMELAHVVVSMIDKRPARVICKTCKSTHNHKKGVASSPLLKASTPRASKKAPSKTVVKVSEMWEQKMAENKSGKVRPYSVQQNFLVGEIIQHPRFGMGLVEQVKTNNKITVLFREDEKILVHGMTGGPEKSA